MSIDGMLKGHELFQSLGFDETHAISLFSSVKSCEAGTTIFTYGDAAGHVYMLMDGAVDLKLPAQHGFSLVVSKIQKGELFGLSPLLDSPRYTATAVCERTTELLSIEAKPLRELLTENCLAGFNIMNQVAHIYFNRYLNVLKSLQGIVGQISLIR